MTFVPSVHVFLSIFAIWSACVSIVYDYQAYPGQQAIVKPTWGYGWSCWQYDIVGVLTLAQHWSNTTVSTVKELLLAQRWFCNYAPTVGFE